MARMILLSSAEEEPAKVSPAVIHGETGACPSDELLTAQIDTTKEEIRDILSDDTIPTLNISSMCPCGGLGQWTKLANLDFSDPSTSCPPNWSLVTTPIRGCVISSSAGATCDSTVFPSNGQSYSRVCGQVNAYQRGETNALEASVFGPDPGIEGVYVDGVSLTHGAAGSRRHIWTFAAAQWENNPPHYIEFRNCACTNIERNWEYQVPLFIGNNYFCDTGNPGPGVNSSTVYSDDPLWDGEGCGPTNTCCQFNNPPWFCITLPQPITDNIEMRICQDQSLSNEAVIVTLADIYIM